MIPKLGFQEEKHFSRIQTSEMRLLRSVKGCTQRDDNNESIRNLNVLYIQHRTEVNTNTMLEGILYKYVWQCKPIERRGKEKPRKRC